MNLQQITELNAFDNEKRISQNMRTKSDNGFQNLGIAPSLLKAIDRLNFQTPTPIQNESIPVALQGEDIIALAQTGSGKTLAFGIPMLQHLSKSKHGIGLILVPTRELALQVDEAIQSISRSVRLRSVVLIGGASMSMQRSALKKNPRIIIATPGRLMDHLERRTLKLSSTEIFILDEADRMLDMGFVPDIKKIIKSLPDKRQTMLFSATMPKEIESIARQLMENPTRIETDRSGQTPADISQEMFMVDNKDKSRLLAHQLQSCSGPVLVFTKTKRMATKLTAKVNDMGFRSAEIHSNKSLGQRRHALEGFKRGRYQILVATDIAARGIDVSGIELVVNYDMPANSEDYVHRIGRTGRAGKQGHAVSYANFNQRRSIKNLERFMKTRLNISKLPTLPSEKKLFEEAARKLAEQPVFDDHFDRPTRKRKNRDENRSNKRFDSNDKPSRRRFKSDDDKPARRRFNSDDDKPARRRFKSDDDKPTRRRFKTDDDKPARKRFDKSNEEKGSNRRFRKDDDQKPKIRFSKDSDDKPRRKKKTGKSKSKIERKTEAKNENPFWSNFKKHRPSKNNQPGHSSKRKKRLKNKAKNA